MLQTSAEKLANSNRFFGIARFVQTDEISGIWLEILRISGFVCCRRDPANLAGVSFPDWAICLELMAETT